MDIWTVLKACVRRWYVFLPVLGLTLWFAYGQMQSMPPTYLATSSATIVGPALVPGDEPGEIVEINPFERLGGSLNATGQVVASLMDSGPKRDQYRAEGVIADYEISQDDAVTYFDVMGGDAESVVTSATRLVELFDTELATLQSRAVEAPESRVRAVALSVPAEAGEDPVAGIRIFAVMAALGLVLAVALALVADAVAQARGRRAEATPGAPPAPGAAARVHAPVIRPLRRLPLRGTPRATARPEDPTQPIALPDGLGVPPEGRHALDDTAAEGSLSPAGQARRHGTDA